MQRYDKIELPPIRPVVTQVERYGCICPSCGELQLTSVPLGLEPGSPFGDSICALATTLRYEQAISYARLSALIFRTLPFADFPRSLIQPVWPRQNLTRADGRGNRAAFTQRPIGVQ